MYIYIYIYTYIYDRKIQEVKVTILSTAVKAVMSEVWASCVAAV